jgi:hypothetical protein
VAERAKIALVTRWYDVSCEGGDMVGSQAVFASPPLIELSTILPELQALSVEEVRVKEVSALRVPPPFRRPTKAGRLVGENECD